VIAHLCLNCGLTHADLEACPVCGVLVAAEPDRMTRGLTLDESLAFAAIPDEGEPAPADEPAFSSLRSGQRFPDDYDPAFDPPSLNRLAADTLHGWRADEWLL
jgi:hypothetical protein